MSEEKMEHSQLPWGVDIGETVKVRTVSGHAVCDLNFVKSVPTITRLPAVQNAWFIATACNSYYDNQQAIAELVEALDKTRHLVADAAVTGLTTEELFLNNATLSDLIAKHKAKP